MSKWGGPRSVGVEKNETLGRLLRLPSFYGGEGNPVS